MTLVSTSKLGGNVLSPERPVLVVRNNGFFGIVLGLYTEGPIGDGAFRGLANTTPKRWFPIFRLMADNIFG